MRKKFIIFSLISVWKDDLKNGIFFLFFFFVFLEFQPFFESDCYSINIKMQTEFSGLSPDTSSLV